MNILAIIPARGGSKGIPRKNIVPVAGKPLIAWTIEAAKKSTAITRVVVSSNDSEILRIADEYGAEGIVRPEELSSDTSSANSGITHTLMHLRDIEQYVPDVLVYLQPTSPLRTEEDIDGAIACLHEKEAGTVISVAEADNGYLKAFFMDNGKLHGIVNDEFPFMNRQELPKIYMPNGAVYVIHTSEFNRDQKLFSQNTIGYLMPNERSVDVDTMEDIAAAEQYLLK